MVKINVLIQLKENIEFKNVELQLRKFGDIKPLSIISNTYIMEIDIRNKRKIEILPFIKRVDTDNTGSLCC